jgi:membrane peptidoglycan carboxypeptidase
MGGYQTGRGDSGGEDPRSPGRGGGSRGYGAPSRPEGAAHSRGYGSEGSGSGGHARQQPPPAQPSSGYGSHEEGYRPYGGPPAGPGPGGAGTAGTGRRGYGSAGSRRRGAEPIPGEVVGRGFGTEPTPGPDSTRVRDAEQAPDPAAPRRSRLEERRAARTGGDHRDAGQTRSDRYPESALNGRSTRNGAAARARTGARGRDRTRPTGPVKKTGYHRYFDYPRTGKYGWRHWAPSIRQVSGCFLAGFFLLLGLVAFEYETVQIPNAHDLALAQQTSYTYDDGSTQFATDGATDRTVVDISQIPAAVQNAVVSQEDKTFWTNPGVSYSGTARALLVDLMGGSTQGGSTITQQYVKQAFLTADQTTSRKVDEIFISLKLSKQLDKKQILADYLNVSPFGRNTSGIAAGVKSWFGISLAQMAKEPPAQQDAQAAFLAMMVNSPTTYSNGWDASVGAQTEAQDKQLALNRWHATLSNMLTYQYITQADYTWAAAHPPKPVPLASASGQGVIDSQMKTAALSWLGGYESQNPNSGLPSVADIQGGGYTVVTTFNQKYMQYANSAVTTQLIDKENKVDKATLQTGLAAVDPSTGDLVAFYGGDANQNNYENNATQRTEQAGSSFKLFTLATAFSQGWSPNSFINGASPWPDKNNPTELAENQGSHTTIGNDDGSHGLISLQEATDASVNTAFIRIEEQVNGQYGAVRDMAEKFGLNDSNMNTNNQWDSSGGCNNVRFTLGICFTDPARMADAYSVIPANGVYHPLTEVLKVVRNSDGTVFKPHTQSSTAIDPNVAAQVGKMLTGVIHNSDGTAHTAYVNSGLNMANIAGKTGTGTMDITPQTDKAAKAAGFNAHACTNSDGSSQCGTGGVWFDGFSSKLAISVGISRWQDITVNGQQVAVQIPVDNIDDSGSAYGAQFPFAIWASFMSKMQSDTPFAGDPAFTAPTANPSQSVMNTPTHSVAPTTPKATQTTTSPTQTTPTQPTDTATPTQTDTQTAGTPTGTCQPGLLSTCSATTSSSPSASSSKSRQGPGAGAGG